MNVTCTNPSPRRSTITIFCFVIGVLFFIPSSAVANAAESVPFYCPTEKVHVSCGDLHHDLDYYGYPKAKSGYYSSIKIHGPYTSKHLNQCGTGYITRKWKIKYHYDWYWCEQTIYVDPSHGYGFDAGKHVYWPKDYHMKDCGGNMHPDYMPKGYNWPDYDYHGCSKVGVTYKDKAYPYNPYHHGSHGYGYGHKPCKVIYRTWEMIDWCQYNNSSYGSGWGSGYGSGYGSKGKWEYVQKIFVYDHEAPVIKSCPKDVEIHSGDCDGEKVYVKIPKVQATDNCGHVAVTYSRKYLGDGGYGSHSGYSSGSSGTVFYGGGVNYSGADASGYYHPGKTKVTFKAFDVCGNYAECEVIVDVKAVDKVPPTPIGLSKITAVLMQMDDNDGMIEVPAEAFNISSYDNCTPSEKLKYSLDRNTFTCADFGPNEVKFIVTDQAGNSDYIIVEVEVQANSFECLGGVISGNVSNDAGQMVGEVEVKLMDGMVKMTGVDGMFEFDKIPLGRNLEISAHKEGGYAENVDMYDFALLSLHVDGIRPLRDPRHLIAADIDGNKVIDYSDLLLLHRVIAGIEHDFRGNASWKFYPSDYTFPDTVDAMDIEMPKYYNITPYNGGDKEVLFKGIKVGDLGSLPGLDPEEVDQRSRENRILTNNQLLQAGEVTTIPFRFEENQTANTMQLSLGFDANRFDLMEVKPGVLSDRGSLSFSAPDEQGVITATWFSMSEQLFSKDEVLFELIVKSRTTAQLDRSLAITTNYADPKIVGVESGTRNLALGFDDVDLEESLILFQNSPNPFAERTMIGVYITEEGQGNLQIRDVSGRAVWSHSQHYQKGYHEHEISADQLGMSGLLFYSFRQGDKELTKKMMQVR